MEILKNLLQKYPEIAVFLTLGIGFLAGRQKFGKFSLPEEAKKLEQQLGGTAMEPGTISAYFPVVARAYRITNPEFAHKTVSQFESAFASQRIFVERVRENGNVVEAEPGMMLEGLYGKKEVKSGADGDAWRIQAGLVYWLWE